MYTLSREEFDIKYNKYSQELMNISYGYTKNKDDSFDVVQNVFYKLFNSNKSFKTDNDEKYWLIRVTINESLDVLRKRKKEVFVDENTIDKVSDDTKDKTKELKLEKLSNLVRDLPKNYKSAIILFYYDLLPIKEIKDILNISESAVKKRLERARDILRKGMGEE